MARKRTKKPQAALMDMLAEAGIELATDVARSLLARRFPQLMHHPQLQGYLHSGRQPKPRARKEKTTEVDLGGGVFYTPARKKTT